ncbi:hypothetical protein HZC35_07735 [Candidatus Saganbacteria bacterium]|nr:hypothetical protein [Candidatus Saganbacteria bacterium]
MFTKRFRILLILALGLLISGTALAGLCRAIENPACCQPVGCDELQSQNPIAPAKTLEVFIPQSPALTETEFLSFPSALSLPVSTASSANFYLIALRSHPSIAPPLI